MSALGASSGTSQNPKEKDPRSLSRDHVTNIESGLNGELIGILGCGSRKKV